jgi:hypothetical protein
VEGHLENQSPIKVQKIPMPSIGEQAFNLGYYDKQKLVRLRYRILYKSEEKSINHLLIHFPFAHFVWAKVLIQTGGIGECHGNLMEDCLNGLMKLD